MNARKHLYISVFSFINIFFKDQIVLCGDIYIYISFSTYITFLVHIHCSSKVWSRYVFFFFYKLN